MTEPSSLTPLVGRPTRKVKGLESHWWKKDMECIKALACRESNIQGNSVPLG